MLVRASAMCGELRAKRATGTLNRLWFAEFTKACAPWWQFAMGVWIPGFGVAMPWLGNADLFVLGCTIDLLLLAVKLLCKFAQSLG